jgi:hypothetical protein
MLLIFFIIMIIILIIYNQNYYQENYWNILPYRYLNDIYVCYDSSCLKKKYKSCVNYCDRLKKNTSVPDCKAICLESINQMSYINHLGNYNFNYINKKFKKYSPLFTDKL